MRAPDIPVTLQALETGAAPHPGTLGQLVPSHGSVSMSAMTAARSTPPTLALAPSLLDLPEPLQDAIFRELGLGDVAAATATCRAWLLLAQVRGAAAGVPYGCSTSQEVVGSIPYIEFHPV
jgi:hypothetical protein